MLYRADPKSGNQLSILGFGCMRFPRSLNTKIDIDKSEKLVMAAIKRGVNYFDTAYIYGGSEQALGEIFKRNQGTREKVNIATKLPFHQCKSYDDFDKIFDIQCKRLHTDYIDYYLIHNLSSVAGWDSIRKLGVEKWIREKKASGQIRRIGFSFHGIQSEFMALLDAYQWDFCQIQYNYMNENYQAGTEGLKKAHEKGLPVIIMEPLLGGKLAVGLPKRAEKLLQSVDSSITPAAWALRWLWNHKEVTVLLSGMNGMEQLKDNIKTAKSAEADMMTEREIKAVEKVVSIFKEAYKVPCTGCNYCLPCPKGVNIPGSFAAYNVSYASGFLTGMQQYLTSIGAISPGKSSSGRNCIKCGRCEKQCPQHIKIASSLERVTKRMEPVWFRAGIGLYKRITK